MCFRQFAPAVEPIHHLQRPARFQFTAALFHPAHERLRFLRVAQPHQRIERERGVADPGVAIIPIALAADIFRQAKSRRGDNGTVRP